MIAQGTEEWRQQRAGCITASRFADAIAMDKRNPLRSTATRDRYMRELCAEILSGKPNHQVSSKSLAWGQENEPYAREAYQLRTGELVEQSEFIQHHQYPFIGCSPDGLCEPDGAIEMKNPLDEQVHVQTWLYGMPEEHIAQTQGVLMVTGRAWIDFISYQREMAEAHRLYIQRIERDDNYINNTLLPGLLQFHAELTAMVAQLRRKAA